MSEVENLTKIQDLRTIVTRLCKLFYNLGWVTGTGGGISIRERSNDTIYITPSGVQKEYIDENDLFVYSLKTDLILTRPANDCLKLSECAPLFLTVYKLRDAGAVMHSHSIHAAFLTILLGEKKEFRISHQEMIKGIKKGSSNESFRYDDTLVVPIIENTAFEKDLTNSLKKAIEDYPTTNAVLVRRHGVYIWGLNYIAAKTMAECYHYLFEIAVKMLQFQLDPVKNE